MAGGVGAGLPGQLDNLQAVTGSGHRVDAAQGDAARAMRARGGIGWGWFLGEH